jgi:hypothetical protein
MSQTPHEQPWIYFARAVDFIDPSTVAATSAPIREALAARRMCMVDPLEYEIESGVHRLVGTQRDTSLVELDLALLRRCDAMLVDMTIPDRNYIGCVSELVYARTWQIPAIVYVGSTGYEHRPWLRYHATYVCHGPQEALVLLGGLFSDGAATGAI